MINYLVNSIIKLELEKSNNDKQEALTNTETLRCNFYLVLENKGMI